MCVFVSACVYWCSCTYLHTINHSRKVRFPKNVCNDILNVEITCHMVFMPTLSTYNKMVDMVAHIYEWVRISFQIYPLPQN